jgi:hypothetical protein
MDRAGIGRQDAHRTCHHSGIAFESFRRHRRAPAFDARGRISDEVKALNFLRQQGFKYLKSVKGGITAWSEEIDSKVARY